MRWFLPLADGRVVTAAPPSGPNGQWVMDEQGAQALVSVWQQLGAARAQIAELEAELAKGGDGNPAYKAAIDALRVALAAD